MSTTPTRIVVKPRQRHTLFEDSKQSAGDQQAVTASATEDIANEKRPSTKLLNRLIALKNLQYEHFKMRTQFYEELFQIEKEYQRKLLDLCDKRTHIINGTHHMPVTYKNSFNGLYDLRLLASDLTQPTKRLPHFWLAVLLNTPVIKNMIEHRDLKCLESLNDLRIVYHEDHSFTIEFHFDRNNYFTNSVLRKRYFQIATIDVDDPFGYDGPEIYRAEGCHIYWKRGKNLTITRVKHDEMNERSTTVNELPGTWACLGNQGGRYVDSFFHFFNPPQFPLEKVVVDMELERVLTIDFEVGNFLRRRVIPLASLVYLKLINSESKVEEARKIVDVTGNAPTPSSIV